MTTEPSDTTLVSELPEYIRDTYSIGDEVEAARGDFDTLNGRISAAIHPDGSLVSTVTVATLVEETSNPTYVAGTQFTVDGDLTGRYDNNRPARFNGGTTTYYVSSSSYNGGTDKTTVTMSSSCVPNPITSLYYGMDPDEMPRQDHADLGSVLGADETSSNTDKTKHVSNNQLKLLWADVDTNTADIAALEASVDDKLDTDAILSCRGKYLRLTAKNNAASPNSKVDVDVDGLGLETLANAFHQVVTADLTIDIATSGANGLDTGSEAPSTWYYIWVIYNSTTDTVAGLLSIDPVFPTLPSGYTFGALVGAVYNDSGSDFITFLQRDRRVMVEANQVLNSATSVGSYSSLDLSTDIPTIAREVKCTAATLGDGSCQFAATSAGLGEVGVDSGTADAVISFTLAIGEDQTIYYQTHDVPCDLYVNGWVYDGS